MTVRRKIQLKSLIAHARNPIGTFRFERHWPRFCREILQTLLPRSGDVIHPLLWRGSGYETTHPPPPPLFVSGLKRTAPPPPVFRIAGLNPPFGKPCIRPCFRLTEIFRPRRSENLVHINEINDDMHAY